MGNTGSSTKRERAYSSDNDCAPSSPGRDDKSFDIGKKNFLYQPSLEENDDFSGTYKDKNEGEVRPRTTTITTGASINETALPTVFKWEGGGKEVYISGSFTDWKPIRMVHSHGDFVLILDVPEGDHQYKFLVDGQWVHDPNEIEKNCEGKLPLDFSEEQSAGIEVIFPPIGGATETTTF